MKLIAGLLLGLLLTATSQGQEIEAEPTVKTITIHGESNEEVLKRLGVPLSQFGIEPKEVKEEVKEPKKKRKRKRKRKAKKMSSEVTWDFELDNIINIPAIKGVDPENMTNEQWEQCHELLLEKLKVLIQEGDISFKFEKVFTFQEFTFQDEEEKIER